MKFLTISIILVLFSSAVGVAQCGMNEVALRVEITTDDYADETYWVIKDQDNEILLQGGQNGVYANNTTYSDSICLVDTGCYFFEIWDTFGDGILAPGGYEFFVDGELAASGSNSIGAYAIETIFCPAVVCDQNQIELRVEIDTDAYGGETYWTISDLNNNVVLEGGQNGAYGNYLSYADSVCAPIDGCYFFEIWDTFGDGILAPGGYRVYVDEELASSGANDVGAYASATVHCPSACSMVEGALNELSTHINGINTLSEGELLGIRDIFFTFPECLASSEGMILLCKHVIEDFDNSAGPLFMTPSTEYGFSKDPAVNPGFGLEYAMVALQQGVFDEIFTPEVFAEFPQHLYQWKFNSCTNFPGDVAPPSDSTLSYPVLIRANFEDPDGMNPFFDINGDGTAHALRPTGLYLAPGSFGSISVPAEFVGQDFYVRVGSHEWDLSNKPLYKRLDRISKKFPILSTTVPIYNPLGGAISILVPFGANQGNVEVVVNNAVEAPFFSLKSFHQTEDFNAELEKPGPWAVFETDNVMYTVPKHSIIPGDNDLKQTLEDWETAVRGVNSIMAREIIPDKHNMYMIADVMIRGGAFSIGYPMSNSALNYIDVPGNIFFMNGPGPDDEVNFHESGHALAMSKFPGEIEALVNVPYIMAMNYGLGVDLNEAVNYSFGPNTFDIDKTATHRMVSNTFGLERDISNTTTDEVRYQHRGYGHYFEIVNMMGWCPLRNFWKQEYIDFQNGIDHGINEQDIDSRIIRMSEAAQADLRPLFHVYGILPQDQEAVQSAIEAAGIPSSPLVYNRLQEYFNLIPEDNAAFVDYALFIYPNLYTDGPNENPDYGVGWHYQKSLTYDAAEAQQRTSTLQSIIDLYYPDGEPTGNVDPDVCCLLDTMHVSIEDEEIIVTGGVEPYDISIDINGNVHTVTVVDYDGCESTLAYTVNSWSEEKMEEGLRIYPNPASTKIYIEWEESGEQIVSSRLISIDGQVLHHCQNADQILDISAIREGMYIVQIELASGVRINKRVLVLK